jgi:hypothetical protein
LNIKEARVVIEKYVLSILSNDRRGGAKDAWSGCDVRVHAKQTSLTRRPWRGYKSRLMPIDFCLPLSLVRFIHLQENAVHTLQTEASTRALSSASLHLFYMGLGLLLFIHVHTVDGKALPPVAA